MLAVVLALMLLIFTVYIHFGFFKVLSLLLLGKACAAHKIVVVVLLLFCAHMVEIFAYALVYYYSYLLPSLGGVEGGALNENYNALYLSLLAYTSLGFSDLHPTGWIRLLVGFEALNGLLLITWSASITFLSIAELWASDVKKGGAQIDKS